MRAWAIALLALNISGCQGSGYTQLLRGFNGPSNPGTAYFSDAESVKASWLRAALTAKQLEQALSQVSFQRQVLVAVAVGKRENATGALTIDRIDRDSAVIPYVLIGVNDTGCSHSHAASYPFVLAVIDRPKESTPSIGYFFQNFPDGCKAVVTGVPNDTAP